MFDEHLEIEGGLYGQSPMQGNGTIGGFRFYFRARHQSWALTISLDGQTPEVLHGGATDGHFKNASGEGFMWGGAVDDAAQLTWSRAGALIVVAAEQFWIWMETRDWES